MEGDEANFLAACDAADGRPRGPHMRRAYYLAVYTVQRQTDILGPGRADYDGTRIALTQSRTGKRIWVPCHERLREALDAHLGSMQPDQLLCLATRSVGAMDEHYLRHEWRHVTLAGGPRRPTVPRFALDRHGSDGGSRRYRRSDQRRLNRILETYIPRKAKMAAVALKLQERADRKRARQTRNKPDV